MRLYDLIGVGLFALRKHKLRSALTVLGVSIGTATLVVSIAVGLGVREVIDEQFRKAEDLRQISVWPSSDVSEDSYEGVPASILEVEGRMSEARRERIRKMRAIAWKRRNQPRTLQPLNQQRLAELARLPHVVEVIPELDEFGRAAIEGQRQDTDARIYGVPFGYKRFQHRVEAGGDFSSPAARECLAHEYLLYRLGVRDDDAVRQIIGQPIRVQVTSARNTSLSLLNLFEADRNLSSDEMEVLEKTWKLLPEMMESAPLPAGEKEKLLNMLKRKRPGEKAKEDKTITADFTIVGVLRAPVSTDKPDSGFLDGPLRDADIILPAQTAAAFLNQLPNRAENGYPRARLIVDHEDNLPEVIATVKRMGMQEYSLGLFIQQTKRNTLLIGFAMDFIALVALVVAALGIMNTMFTTVMERTREIGILKAVGAKDRQVLSMFLIEGSLIGLGGGIGGVIFGWLASFPGNEYALRILEKQGHSPLPTTVFLYPVELLVAVPLFAMLMTTLAAMLPARRAARIEPVIALRHE